VAHPTLSIGPYVVGEIPAALEYQFLDAGGNPLNLTGYTAKFQWGRRDATATFVDAVTVNAVVTDGPNGKITRNWDGTEFLIQGDYAGMFWVGNGTNRFASLLIEWDTCLAVNTPPVI
jgi:hypothetical protein